MTDWLHEDSRGTDKLVKEAQEYKDLVPKAKELPKTEGYKKGSGLKPKKSKVHVPSFLKKSPSKSKLTYKVGNPLKKLLTRERVVVKVGGW